MIMQEEPAASLELREPPPPGPLLPAAGPPPGLLAAAAVALLAALAGAWLWWRRKCKKKPTPEELRKAALRQARAGLEAVKATAAPAAAVQASLILRRYLAAAAGDPSLYETHEEFITRADALEALTPAAREACRRGFASLAALKYMPADGEDGQGAEQALAQAAELLETLHRGFGD